MANKYVKTYNIKIENEEFEKAVDEAFEKKVKDIKLDGFRKGKVPKDIYMKRFGKASLYSEVVDILLPTAYQKVISDNKVLPVVQPKVDIKSMTDDGVEFEFVVVTKPDVNIKKYKGLKVKKAEIKVSQEEIDAEIDQILKRYSEVKIKESGIVEKGNVAVIDFEGFNDGVAFEGGKAEAYSIEIGSNTFIPGFEDQLIGMKKGEEKDIKVTFPEEYPSEELKGKEVVFKVKLNEVKEKEERCLDAELFQDLAMEGVDSKESLEKEIKLNIEARKEMDNENAYVDDLLKAVAKNTDVDLPQEMIDDELDRMVDRFSEQLKMQGVSLEVYLEMTKTKMEDLRNQMSEEAKNHVIYRLILEKIIEVEKIKVTEKEAQKEAEESAKKYNVSVEEFLKMLGGIDMITYDLEMKKVIDILKENN
ncbi:MAG TPA: trigger factor [Bacilli bacterium]|nr:trigger factor [Bacilli bacterium]